MQLKGVDVSRYQGDINWAAVAADGISFAMIKALQGANAIDKMFSTNAEGAAAAGLPFGIYVYSKAKDVQGAEAEAQAALELAADYRLQYPIAFDFEAKHFLLMESSLRGEIINAFCSAIKKAGYLPMLYSNKDWLLNVIPNECAKNWDVWLAQWRKTAPDYAGAYTMWQYGRGEVAGVSGKVDMDICFVDYPSVIDAARPVHFAVTTPRLRGDAVLQMQKALSAANYKDQFGDPIIPDGIWGAKSQTALDKLVRMQENGG